MMRGEAGEQIEREAALQLFADYCRACEAREALYRNDIADLKERLTKAEQRIARGE